MSKKKRGHGHVSAGKYVKSFVYGGLDGIITTFAVVAGVAGAQLSASVVLILGFANLVADGISMAFGDYLSSKAEGEYGRNERKRENEAMSKSKKVPLAHMIRIYMKQGFNRKQASSIAKVVCKNKEACVEVMLNHELGISKPGGNPVKNALTTFGSFAIFGFVPLIAYVFANFIPLFGGYTFEVASVLTGLTLFVLGAVKYKITGMNWFKSGMEMLLIGGGAAIAAYLIGYFVSGIV
jgi:vacuolar iron transporter family protein